MITIKSNVLGMLRQNEQLKDWWESDPIEIPFFDNKKLMVIFMYSDSEKDPNFIYEADQALKAFLEKKTDDRIKLSELAYQNCMDFLHEVEYDEADKPLWDIQDKNEIWHFIYPKEIYVIRIDEDIYIEVVCDCDWEQEHGLKLVFNQGKKFTHLTTEDG